MDAAFACPFKLESERQGKSNMNKDEEWSGSASSSSFNMEELADFNKIMEKQFKENIK